MNKSFYPKLAASNMKKNKQFTLPYLITGICTIAMYYMMGALADNPHLAEATQTTSSTIILFLGTIVVGIFSVIILFYSDSFLMKRRKKELGLYNILGMEKKHIGITLFFETIYSWLITSFLGILTGMLFSKLLFMGIVRLIQGNIGMGYYISIKFLIQTMILFGGIYLVSFLYHLLQLKLNKPIELLHGSSVGEKEPKTKIIMTIIGLVCLGSGYYISITTKSPIRALNLFFFAVILVIIGTYFLFTAGSIALLKFLRKNKGYYYQTKHFTSISGLMYRMKQNAVGLASICILSTMVLVMVSSTICLYGGAREGVNKIFPRNTRITLNMLANEDPWKVTTEEILAKAKTLGYEIENPLTYYSVELAFLVNGNSFQINNIDKVTDYSSISYANFIDLESYETITKTKIKLKDNEVLATLPKDSTISSFNIFNKEFTIKGKMEDNTFNFLSEINSFAPHSYLFVVSSKEMLKELSSAYKEAPTFNYNLYLDVKGDTDKQIACKNELKNWLVEDKVNQNFSYGYTISSQYEEFLDSLQIYGIFFFLGLFLGLLFLAGTVLIIYYKQISEGYEDHDRYQIMQKVGMSLKEVKQSIHSQILTVFFLPPITAAIHIAFAFPIITRLLFCFNMTDTSLFLQCTIVSIIVFCIIYALVYLLTAKIYYRLVTTK